MGIPGCIGSQIPGNPYFSPSAVPPKPVTFTFTPKALGVHLSIGCLTFPLTKFGREEARLVTVCNEGPNDVVVSGEFVKDPLPQPPMSESSIDEKEDAITEKLISEAVSMHSVLLYDFEDNSSVQTVLYSPGASQHFDFYLPNRIPGGTSADISVCFRPNYDPENLFPGDMEPPYFQRTRATFCFTDGDDCIESHMMVLSGKIAGVELEVHPRVIDFRKIYLGEEHCAQIKVLNVDGENCFRRITGSTLSSSHSRARAGGVRGLLEARDGRDSPHARRGLPARALHPRHLQPVLLLAGALTLLADAALQGEERSPLRDRAEVRILSYTL